MAPPQSTTLISPAELSYLRSSLALNPPIRPDARSPAQFRPLVAEIDILPSTNGSARMIWGDGGECVVGVKVEVEPTELTADGKRRNWVEIGVEVQGQRDDDPLGVFLGMTVTESLLTPSSTLTERLAITSKFHWKMYIDILLITPPLSHPGTLLSLSTNLALRSTRLPRLASEADEDPMFDDDWDASVPLYQTSHQLPPITLLVLSVGDNIFFDPTKEELAVADCVLAVSLATNSVKDTPKVIGVRTLESGNGGIVTTAGAKEMGSGGGATVESTSMGGVKRTVVKKIIKESLSVGKEVFGSLQGVVDANH
ncbi:ribosomal protein S5 domain 2-type protein [Morchella snyderi]|nr:ribosomal protein S5 domain 2-type protein [Morchella snyderi]